MAYVVARQYRARLRRGMGSFCDDYPAECGMAPKLNCPGDPGCPGYVAPVPSDYTYTGTSMPVPTVPGAAPATSLTAWLNANAKYVAIGAAGFLGLLMMRGR
jgi:hypothetical protein